MWHVKHLLDMGLSREQISRNISLAEMNTVIKAQLPGKFRKILAGSSNIVKKEY